MTAARSATWVGPATSAGGLYVGASRGRWENKLHVVADGLEEARDILAGRCGGTGPTGASMRPGPGPRRRPSGPPPSASPAPSSYRRGGAARPSSKPPCAGWRPPWPAAGPGRPGGRSSTTRRWRAETEADRAVAKKGRSTAAWYEAEAARARAGRGELLEQAQAEFSQAREDARVIAAGPGRFGRRAERVREAERRRAETAERWQGYFNQLPGERWPDEAVARAATSAVDARLAHQLRFYEAERDKAAGTAQQAEERIARRNARREKALAHNEMSATKRLELEASAEEARAMLVEARRAMTAGMAPEEVLGYRRRTGRRDRTSPRHRSGQIGAGGPPGPAAPAGLGPRPQQRRARPRVLRWESRSRPDRFTDPNRHPERWSRGCGRDQLAGCYCTGTRGLGPTLFVLVSSRPFREESSGRPWSPKYR